MILLSVLFLILLVSFGIPLSAKLAGFVSNLGKSNESIDIGDTTPPAPPRIAVLPEFTNQKNLEISGETEPGATVSLNFNSQTQEIVADKEGKFSVKYSLSEGKNTFFAIARDQANNESQKTAVMTIIFDQTAPEVTIENPKDQAEYYGPKQSQLTISGQTEAGAVVTVNDRLATLDQTGRFSLTTRLSEGENTLTIKVVDKAGNETEKTLTVRYTP